MAVAVEPDRVEDLVVALAQGLAHRGEDRQRLGIAAIGAPPPREARLGEPTLVHGHRPLPPRRSVQQLVEDEIMAVQPIRSVVEPGVTVELEPLQGGELLVDRRSVDPEQRSLSASELVFADMCSMLAVSGQRQVDLGHTDGMPAPIPVDDPADPRLADYVELTDAAARRRRERDEIFITEGATAIERLLDSGHAIRSVLLTPKHYAALVARLERLDAPVYLASQPVLAATVGFDLHRGAVAAAGGARCRRWRTCCSPPAPSPSSKG